MSNTKNTKLLIEMLELIMKNERTSTQIKTILKEKYNQPTIHRNLISLEKVGVINSKRVKYKNQRVFYKQGGIVDYLGLLRNRKESEQRIFTEKKNINIIDSLINNSLFTEKLSTK